MTKGDSIINGLLVGSGLLGLIAAGVAVVHDALGTTAILMLMSTVALGSGFAGLLRPYRRKDSTDHE